MRNIAFYFIIILLFLGFYSCDNQNEYEKPILTSTSCQNIIDLQDKRDSKALIPYFVDDDYQLRVQSALAFGSIADTSALNSLYTMLEEEEPIAQAAAFAIGQIGDARSVEVLKRILERSMQAETRFEIFDAMGKCGDIDLNYYLASSYNVGKDAKGTAWALMELSNRKKLNPAGLQLAITILENEIDYDVRFAAAHAIARTELDVPWKEIKSLILVENIQDIKIALVAGLKQIPAAEIDQEMIYNLEASFYLIQLNALKSFRGKENRLLDKWVDSILKSDANINLKITAAEFLTSIPGKSESYLESNKPEDLNWRVRTVLLKDAILQKNTNAIYLAILNYEATSNLYEKGMLLEALGQLPGKKEWLIEEIMENDSIVSTYGMEGLVSLVDDSERKGFYAPYLYETLQSKHDAVVSLTAIACRNEAFIDLITVGMLTNKQDELDLPRQSEAYLELEKTIRFYTGKKGPLPTMKYNHPIDISRLEELDSLKGFLVETTKGDFYMQVFPEEAPGTVQSIKNLVDKGYYNNKLFHRVVPNFVAQTGCPDGDGWGSLDFSIRSEFSRLRYYRGAVGMASAGKDTESCQWFVTHSPTPHLNGRYTIFANVTKGMEIVDVLEVGDRILSMESVYE